MKLSDLENFIKELFDENISPFLELNHDNIAQSNIFFEKIEKNIAQKTDYPFFISVLKIPFKENLSVHYVSQSFYNITGIKPNEPKTFDLFYNSIEKESENVFLNIIKRLKENKEISTDIILFKKANKDIRSFFILEKINKFNNEQFFTALIFDITKSQEKKESTEIKEKTHHKKQSLSSSILQNAPFSIMITNIIGQIIYVNPRFEKLTGYSKKELLGKNPRILQSGLTEQKTYKQMWEKLISGHSWEGSFVNKKKNKEIYFEKAIIFPFIDKKNKISKYIALKADITKEIKLQNKIIKTKNIENNILKLSNIGFCQIQNDKIISVNSKLLELVGIEKNDIFNKKLNKTPTSLSKIFKILLENTKNNESFNFETFFSETNKHLDFVSYRTQDGLSLIITDITKIKKTEESLIYRNFIQNELIEFFNIALVSYDEFGRIINTNQTFDRLIKSENQKLINKDITNYFPEKAIKKIIIEKEILNISTIFEDSKNKIHNVVIGTKFLSDNLRNNKRTIYCQIEDKTNEINEKDYLEKMVKQKTKELEKSLQKEKDLNILKTDFISKTSHEFRTPLATISVASEFIKKFRDKMTKEQLSAKIDKVLTQTQYMEKLLNDILLVGRFDSQKLPFDPKPTNIYNFLNEMITEFKNLKPEFTFNFINNAKIVTTELDDRLGRSIFQNLISNAIKYSAENKTINIELLNDENNEHLIIEIQDFGIGIPDKYKNKLFSSFVRADNAAALEGTGLGLTIVKKAIEKHKGSIFFTSELNHGTTFWVHLPLQ